MKKQLPLSILLAFIMLFPTWAQVSAASSEPTSQNTSKLWDYPTSQYQEVTQLNQFHPSALKGKVIVVDPGHGGSDTGAIGPNNIAEKTVTLAIARDLRTLLSNQGVTVIMTRTSDQDVAYPGASSIDELQARVAIANNANADLFISIHADSFSEAVHGTTTYYYPGSDSSLANFVQDSLIDQLKLSNRGFQPNDYYVLKYTTMPAILTEAAFISNPTEERLLSNRAFDRKIATGIYNGIKNYFSRDLRA